MCNIKWKLPSSIFLFKDGVLQQLALCPAMQEKVKRTRYFWNDNFILFFIWKVLNNKLQSTD